MFRTTPPQATEDRGVRVEGPGSWAGFVVLDPLGRKIGEVEQLFSDGRARPKHLKVKIGGLFATRSVLIPVRDVDIDGENRTLALL